MSSDIYFRSAADLGRMLRARRVTSVDLTQGYLDRLRTIGNELNAVVTLMEDSALEKAKRADQEIRWGRSRSPLHGVPYGVKDLLATRGVPTTWGSG